jgi:hypothetical protein
MATDHAVTLFEFKRWDEMRGPALKSTQAIWEFNDMKMEYDEGN